MTYVTDPETGTRHRLPPGIDLEDLADLIVEVNLVNGHVAVSDLIDGHLVSQTFIGYTELEAKIEFARYSELEAKIEFVREML